MEEIAAGVVCVPVSIANVYFVGRPGEPWALVDTSVPGKAEIIRKAAERRYGLAKPEAILLTHGHWDHAGSAADLADYWGVPILAHRLELPYLTGRSGYPPPDVTAPGFLSFASRFFGNRSGGFNLGSRIRAVDGSDLPGMPGWEWFHTPGHAPGHLTFFRRSDATLLAGDAITTVNLDSLIAILAKTQRVCRPPTTATVDWKAARESVRLLASLEPFTLACGHGAPMTGMHATQALTALAREFPIPRHGRYVNASAMTGESGIEWLPPSPPDRLPKVAMAIGIAAGAALLASSRRKPARAISEPAFPSRDRVSEP
ncbi:MAG: MBL fold metallo-hydrolase [Bryobacteraceae bacterium]